MSLLLSLIRVLTVSFPRDISVVLIATDLKIDLSIVPESLALTIKYDASQYLLWCCCVLFCKLFLPSEISVGLF
jgi:hypothetical protein